MQHDLAGSMAGQAGIWLRRKVWHDVSGCGGWYGVTVQAVAVADGMAVSAQDVK